MPGGGRWTPPRTVSEPRIHSAADSASLSLVPHFSSDVQTRGIMPAERSHSRGEGTDSEMHGVHGEGDVEEWRDLELWGFAENLKMACETSLTQLQKKCLSDP